MFYLLQYTVLYVGSFDIFFKTLFVLRVKEGPLSAPKFYFYVQYLAPVCANMIQILVHTCRGLGCSIFIEINVKRRSNPSPLKVFNILHCSLLSVSK